MKQFFKNLRFLFMPNYWILNEPFDARIDSIVSDLLDKYEFTDISEYTGKLGDVRIWIANLPYAVNIYDDNIVDRRPSRATIYRLVKKLGCAKEKYISDKINEFKNKHLTAAK